MKAVLSADCIYEAEGHTLRMSEISFRALMIFTVFTALCALSTTLMPLDWPATCNHSYCLMKDTAGVARGFKQQQNILCSPASQPSGRLLHLYCNSRQQRWWRPAKKGQGTLLLQSINLHRHVHH